MYILKTNTATRIAVGPLVDPTNGKTAETALTVTGLSMQLYQIKTDGTAVVRTQVTPTASSGDNDMALVTSSTDGMYDLELTAAQLNWLGNGRITFYDVDGFLVHWIDIQVVSAAYFDWIFGTTKPEVNVKAISDDTTAPDVLELFIEALDQSTGQIDDGTLKTGAITAASIAADAITEAKIADNAIAAEHLNATAVTKIIDDFETQSAADPTGFKVNVMEINGTAQTAGDVGAKTGFALSATGADLILKSSTFIQAIVAAINELATYGLTALNTLLVTTGIKTATTAAPTDMAKESTLADIETKIDDTFDDVGSVQATADLILGDTGTELPATLASILEDTGTTLPATLAAMTTAISGGAAAVWNYLTTALTTVGSIGKWFADWFAETPAGATSLGASDLTLVNNALTLLGHDTLADLLGTDKATTICVQHYQQVVDAVLRAYQWNCAMTRSSELTAESTAPSFGYDYKYALPDGCLRVLQMQELDYKFKVEGGYLLTDEESAYILYIARISPASMDALLKGAISAALAATIAFPLTNSSTAAKQMWDLYQAKLDEARTTDAFEGTHEAMQPSEDSDWIIKRS